MKNVNLALTALLLCGSLNAKESDFAEKVYVDAVKQVAEMQDNRITFSEDVIITQGTIKIKADKVQPPSSRCWTTANRSMPMATASATSLRTGW